MLPQNRSALKPGQWYLVVQCEYCLTKHVLMPDQTNGQEPLRQIQQATCPSCRRVGFHAPATVQRYQHPYPSDASK